MKDNDLSGRYICFSINKEKFAIPLLQVKEVIGNAKTTPIPKSPPYFRGIMNLRGQVISILDLKSKLEMGKPNDDVRATIIILDFETVSVGVVVDTVDCVSTFKKSDIGDAEDVDTLIKNKFVIGVAKSDNALTLLIDLKAALNVKDFKIIDEQASASKAA